jgi:hypothetical protein
MTSADAPTLETRLTPIRLVGVLVLAAVLPAVFAVVLLVSATLRRPVLGSAFPLSKRETAQRLTVVWGIVLLMIAAVQAAGAIAGWDRSRPCRGWPRGSRSRSSPKSSYSAERCCLCGARPPWID